MTPFSYTLTHKDKKTNARLGVIHTPHGDIQTPAFVPVGTQGTVKSLTPDELRTLGVQVFFVNTYHMYLRPGMDVIKKVGGIHSFMGWNGPLMTDSGGFQVFSLARQKYVGTTPLAGRSNDDSFPQLVKITEDGVEFRSHWDGSKHIFTPESSMQWQWQMGSDIHIAFDDCPPYPVTHEKAKKSMERTHRWAKESLEAHKRVHSSWNMVHSKSKTMNNEPLSMNHYQALYGSIQGSTFEDLRKESAKFISNMDVDGIAIGGVAVGESKKEMVHVLDWVMPILPPEKPRHLLGVGEIDDIFALVERGVDTFDCVQPTRLARMGQLFKKNPTNTTNATNTTNKFTIDIARQQYATETNPIDESCSCYTCTHFSRAYIHHLFHVRELLAYRLATIHNLHFMETLMKDIRAAIADDSFLELKKQWLYNR